MEALRADPAGVFASDEHRHVAGHLSQPRSFYNLSRELVSDATVNLTNEQLGTVLSDLADSGLVVKLEGPFTDGESLVEAVQAHADAITMPDEKAERLVERIASSAQRGVTYLEGEQWILAEQGLDTLNAPAVDAGPPLEGEALARAEEFNARLAEEDELLVEQEREAQVERLRAQLEQIESGDIPEEGSLFDRNGEP